MSNLLELWPRLLDLSAIIAAFLTGIAGPLIVTYVRFKTRKHSIELAKRKEDFVNSLKTQDIVNNSLNKLQEQYNLDRIWLAQFHNGGNFYPGNKCMKKMSVTFESTAPGISADIMKMQNLPVSFFSSVLQKLNDVSEQVTVDVQNEEDHALKSFWETRGVTLVHFFPIICIKGGFIGVLGIDFIKQDKDLTKLALNNIKREAHLLSGYVASLSVEIDK